MSEFKLGLKVRDRVSGLVGILDILMEKLDGTHQWCVRPEGDGKTVPDGNFIDEHQLEILGEGLSKTCPPVQSDVKVRIGNKVKDIATGFTGIAISKNTYLNGCVYFVVQPEAKKPDVLPEPLNVTHSRLKVLAKGLAVDPPKAPKQTPSKGKLATGGPMMRANAIRTV